MELVFNHDAVVMCEYPTLDITAQCKENPLMKMWKDFNQSKNTDQSVKK